MKDILQNTTEIVVAFEKVMEGNAIGVFQLLDKIRKSVNCIRDAMFYEKISALMNELDSHQTDKRKIGELLAKSDYCKDYGFALLKYIDDFESIDKGRYLAHLLDSLSKDFITAQECFIYARLLKDVYLNGLLFVKNNVSSRRFDKNLILRELFRYNLMYEANEGGYAFEIIAYYLDKFALSYCVEKYKYNGEEDYIPSKEKFPKRVSSIVISQGKPY